MPLSISRFFYSLAVISTEWGWRLLSTSAAQFNTLTRPKLSPPKTAPHTALSRSVVRFVSFTLTIRPSVVLMIRRYQFQLQGASVSPFPARAIPFFSLSFPATSKSHRLPSIGCFIFFILPVLTIAFAHTHTRSSSMLAMLPLFFFSLHITSRTFVVPIHGDKTKPVLTCHQSNGSQMGRKGFRLKLSEYFFSPSFCTIINVLIFANDKCYANHK